MFAINEADGSLKWSYNTGDYPWGGIAVAGGIAYAGTTGFFTSPAVYAVDEHSGAFIWFGMFECQEHIFHVLSATQCRQRRSRRRLYTWLLILQERFDLRNQTSLSRFAERP